MSEQLKTHRAMLLIDNPKLLSVLPESGLLLANDPVDVVFADEAIAAIAAKDARIVELESENSHLRHGMTGDYDLDAWLEWCAKKDATPSEDGGEVPEIVGKFCWMDEDMGDGYYVQCVHDLPEHIIDNERELMTVAQCKRIVAAKDAEIAELDALRERLSSLLSQSVIAIRGPEPELTRWGYADLPLRVKAVVEELEVKYAEIARLRELHENSHSAAKTLIAERATLMEQAAHWLEVNAPSGGCIETNIADELRAQVEQLRAQPARQVGGDEREQFEPMKPDAGLLLKYARHAAWAIGGGNYSYCPADPESAEEFFPHTWVTQAIYSAFVDGQCYQAGESNSRMQRYGLIPKARAALAPAAVVMPDDVRVNLDSLWADAAYLCARLEQGSMSAGDVVKVIRGRIDAAKAALSLNRRAIPVELLEKAAELLNGYQQAIEGCHSSEIERFDYLPEVQGIAAELRALLGKEGE